MRVGNIVGAVATAGIAVLILLAAHSTTTSSAATPATTVFIWQTTSTAATTSPPTTTEPVLTSAVDDATVASTATSNDTTPDRSTTTTVAVDRANLRVRVLNAGARSGTGKALTAVLQAAAFRPIAPGNGTVRIDRSVVMYAAGNSDAAKIIAGALGLANDRVVPSTLDDKNWAAFGDGRLDVLVIAGPT